LTDSPGTGGFCEPDGVLEMFWQLYQADPKVLAVLEDELTRVEMLLHRNVSDELAELTTAVLNGLDQFYELGAELRLEDALVGEILEAASEGPFCVRCAAVKLGSRR
jgi:hypothetical protein